MKIRLNIDEKQFADKPAGSEINKLRVRLCNVDAIREIDPAELLTVIDQGQSFTPAEMTGTTGKTWQSQQVFCADIDNQMDLIDENGNRVKDENGKTIHVMIDNPMTPQNVVTILERYGIRPYCMYNSFSNKQDWPKFRIVLIADQAVTDKAEALAISTAITWIMNRERPGCADTTNADAARLFFGSYRGSVFYDEAYITPLDMLRELPQSDPDDLEDMPQQKPAQLRAGGKLAALQARFEHDKENFDLARYIRDTTASRPKRTGNSLFFNPCPVCGHNNDFHVTGSIFYCHQSNVKQGGTIIDYLMIAEGLDRAAALEKFKFEIMCYDRAEWLQAWKEEQDPARMERAGQDKAVDPSQSQGSETADQVEGAAEQEKDILAQFLEDVQTEKFKPYKTGLSFFDKLLEGGVIRQTLLLLMAAPATGKTTLCQQFAEEMAAHGKPVIYINLEMSRDQMIAKSISSRLVKKGIFMSALDIMQGYKWTDEQRRAVIETVEEYRRTVAPNLRYNPDSVGTDLGQIRNYLQKMGNRCKQEGSEAPVIILDYLHLVTSADQDVQERIKYTVKVLKDYAIEYNTFCMAISAVNREGAKGQIRLESGRDSSNLEYTADYQLSLDYYALDKKDRPDVKQYLRELQNEYGEECGDNRGDQIAALQRMKWRHMLLRVLKGRFCAPGRSARLYFYPAGNSFYGEYDWMPVDSDREPFPGELGSGRQSFDFENGDNVEPVRRRRRRSDT